MDGNEKGRKGSVGRVREIRWREGGFCVVLCCEET